MRSYLPLALGFSVVVAAACSSSDDDTGLFAGPGGGAGAAAEACVPNKQQACRCGEELGIQVCGADGRFEACSCSAGGGTGGASGSSSGGSSAKGGSTSKGGTGGGAGSTPGGSGGTMSGLADPDGDGFTGADGDCDNSNPDVNPGAFEVPGNDLDDDCNGQVDDDATACDGSLGPVLSDALDAARAIGLCDVDVPVAGAKAGQRRPGVIAAAWSNIGGSFLASPPATGANIAQQIGALPDFGGGTPVQEGARLLALSSGVARATGQQGAVTEQCSNSQTFGELTGLPPGFPKAKNECAAGGDPRDAIAVDMRLRVPNNAKSFSVRYKFFTCEYPTFACSEFNDIFALIMTPSPLAAGDPFADAGNVTADVVYESRPDGSKNVISVNATSLLTVCEPAPKSAPKHLSCGGEAGLAGSGFEGRGATDWLEVKVPIPAFAEGADRVITLRYAIWDSSDALLDSTVVVDRFRWSTEPVETAKTSAAP